MAPWERGSMCSWERGRGREGSRERLVLRIVSTMRLSRIVGQPERLATCEEWEEAGSGSASKMAGPHQS